MILTIHVLTGALAMILGAVALIVTKGGTIHRRSGMLFVYAMIVMAVTASVLEFLDTPAATNLTAALLTIYFVGTALTTVRPPSRWTRAIDIVALTIAVSLALVMIAGGIAGIQNPGRSAGGVPLRTVAVMSFILGAVLLLCAAGDLRMLRYGLPRGGPRLARHLWRMCFALFIAAGSFFSIRERVEKVLPEPFATGPMRLLPILLLFGTMFYWLWRVRRRRAPPVVLRHGHGQMPAAAPAE